MKVKRKHRAEKKCQVKSEEEIIIIHDQFTNFSQILSASQSSNSDLGSHDSVLGPSPTHCTKYWYPQPCFLSSTIPSMNHPSPLSLTTVPRLCWVLKGNRLGLLGQTVLTDRCGRWSNNLGSWACQLCRQNTVDRLW